SNSGAECTHMGMWRACHLGELHRPLTGGPSLLRGSSRVLERQTAGGTRGQSMNELVTWGEVKQVLAFTDDDMAVWVRDGEWWVDLPNLNLAYGLDDQVFHSKEVNQFVHDLRELVALREQGRAGRRLSKE